MEAFELVGIPQCVLPTTWRNPRQFPLLDPVRGA